MTKQNTYLIAGAIGGFGLAGLLGKEPLAGFLVGGVLGFFAPRFMK